MTSASEDRIRDAYAYIRAHATGDTEAMRVLADNTDLAELVDTLAQVAAMLIRNLAGDPIRYLDATFDAISLNYWEQP